MDWQVFMARDTLFSDTSSDYVSIIVGLSIDMSNCK